MTLIITIIIVSAVHINWYLINETNRDRVLLKKLKSWQKNH